MGKSTIISMAIFNSYVSSPEGMPTYQPTTDCDIFGTQTEPPKWGLPQAITVPSVRRAAKAASAATMSEMSVLNMCKIGMSENDVCQLWLSGENDANPMDLGPNTIFRQTHIF